MKRYFVGALVALVAISVHATDFTFESSVVRLTVGPNGHSKSLQEKASGRQWLVPNPTPLFAMRKKGKWYFAKDMKRIGTHFHVDFGPANVKGVYSITGHHYYIVFELVGLQGEDVEAIRLAQLQTKDLSRSGQQLAVRWNKEFAISALGLSPRVHSSLEKGNLITATVYPEFGMVGEKIALVAVPTARFLDTIRIVERDFNLPSPTIEGEWAKRSDDVRASYLFIDLTEANVERIIKYAKLGGFKYILIYAKTWASSLGSYPINTRNFPKGEDSLKAVVDKVHDADLKLGIHTLTSLVGKDDPLVRPIPDGRLLKDAKAILAVGLDAKTTEIRATAPLKGFPTNPAFYGTLKAGLDTQIDNEIIRCRDMGVSDARRLLQCKRGFAGTKAMPHRKGATIYHLAERYGSYLADLRTSLKGEISERIAGLINRLGLDMVYFDAGEVNNANGSAWYWVGQQQEDTLRRIDRDLLVQGSGWTHWNWHRFHRGACDDYVTIATREYLDHHKIRQRWRHYRNTFMPAELGWWALLNYTPDHPATKPEEFEHHAIRMLALDTPVSLETTVAKLKANGRTKAMLGMLGRFEHLRLEDDLPNNTRQALREGRWHWEKSDERFYPVHYHSQRVGVPGAISVYNQWHKQPLKFRLEVMPGVAGVGDKANIPLLQLRENMVLPTPAEQAPMPGALIHRIEFVRALYNKSSASTSAADEHDARGESEGHPMDLSKHRAVAVRLRIQGAVPNNAQSYPILNIQLESSRKRYRDYYVDLDFTGKKTIVISKSNVERMLPTLRPSPKNYRFRQAMRHFDYKAVVALNLRWMNYWSNKISRRIEIEFIEALAEGDSVVKELELQLENKILKIPTVLKTGDYMEYWGEGPIKVFDRNGMQQLALPIQGNTPVMNSGSTQLILNGHSSSPVQVTIITINPDHLSQAGARQQNGYAK